MSKIISVWGNPGSGKSVFCAILAKELTRDKEKALIISADAATPMLPVWLPNKAADSHGSIGHVFSAMEISKSLVAGKIQVYEPYPYIGLMGYEAGESPLTYPEPTYETTCRLLDEAVRLVDYVIVDCGASVTNFFTPTAMEYADIVVRILTPDLRGISYLKAQTPLLRDPRFQLKDHITFAGMARPFHAIDEMAHVVGGLDGILPYSKEIENSVVLGKMFEAGSHCHIKYTASVGRVLKEAFDDWSE